MKPFLLLSTACPALLFAASAGAEPAPVQPAAAPARAALTVTAEGIGADGYLSPDTAFCVAAPPAQGYMKEGPDKSVGLAWSKGPEGTKSYAIIEVDPDVPAQFDDANKPGKTVAAGAPRRNFYHWVLVDIPAQTVQIPYGTDSQNVVKRGKAELTTPYGMRGVNDYAPYFAPDPDRKGVYAGYDGSCPPWNDERVHHYHLKVFALDTASLGLAGQVTGAQAEDAIARHTLAQGEVIGLYTLNPSLKKP